MTAAKEDMLMDGLAGSDGNAASEKDQMDIQLSVISPLVAGSILANAHRLDEVFAASVPAIVLCADIAGFSVAGAKLTRSDERGAEDLRSIVSTVFDRVIGVILVRHSAVRSCNSPEMPSRQPGHLGRIASIRPSVQSLPGLHCRTRVATFPLRAVKR
ncbi:MAG: hypothetical protein U5L45_27205 [Saprospiraceae bacterium]|nr:hypothetical protein [Saprospiraceae bacterium]